MKVATRRRETPKVTLLARSRSVLKYRTDGRGKVRQSSDDPLRTIRALVNAANIIVMAKSTTQMPVEDGGGEYSSATWRSSFPGTRFLQPPFPECPWSGERCGSIFGGSGIMVAILVNFLPVMLPLVTLRGLSPHR